MDTKIDKLKISITHGIFLADIHFGVRQNSEEWIINHSEYFHNFFIPKLKEYINSLPENSKPGIFILGDINDNRKAIDINVSNSSIDIIDEIRKICPIFLLTGNHDLSKRTNYGNNSLRPFSFQDNVTLISVPTEIELSLGKGKKKKHIIAIPYMGSFNEETKYLLMYKDTADYALMHTEISKMKMDNGMSITSGVNPDAFNGMIFAGHIHKRQETKKVIYVGSPFQMSRGDIGNQKGIYTVDFNTAEINFIPNDYSPIFQNIQMEDFLKMDINERAKLLNNNYNFILIDETKLNSYKRKVDIYNLKEGTTARCIRPVIIRNHKEVLSSMDISTGNKERTIEELIIEAINNLEIDDNIKEKVHTLNKEYFKAGLAKQMENGGGI